MLMPLHCDFLGLIIRQIKRAKSFSLFDRLYYVSFSFIADPFDGIWEFLLIPLKCYARLKGFLIMKRKVRVKFV